MFVSRARTGGRLGSGEDGRDRRSFHMMTNTSGTDVDPSGLDRWDWSSTVLVALGVVLAILLTFEVWTSH
jgi:hypothetical protein